MDYLVSASTDIGIKKNTNQDSLAIKVAETSIGKVAFALVCDGMGGLQHGEVASANLILAFSNWFDNDLPRLIERGLDNDKLVRNGIGLSKRKIKGYYYMGSRREYVWELL